MQLPGPPCIYPRVRLELFCLREAFLPLYVHALRCSQFMHSLDYSFLCFFLFFTQTFFLQSNGGFQCDLLVNKKRTMGGTVNTVTPSALSLQRARTSPPMHVEWGDNDSILNTEVDLASVAPIERIFLTKISENCAASTSSFLSPSVLQQVLRGIVLRLYEDGANHCYRLRVLGVGVRDYLVQIVCPLLATRSFALIDRSTQLFFIPLSSSSSSLTLWASKSLRQVIEMRQTYKHTESDVKIFLRGEVNTSRTLLLQGAAGSGKSSLVYGIAEELQSSLCKSPTQRIEVLPVRLGRLEAYRSRYPSSTAISTALIAAALALQPCFLLFGSNF